MAQDDVLNILKTVKHGHGLTSKEIHQLLLKKGKDIGLGTVTSNIKKLIRGKMVLRYYTTRTYKQPKYILVEKATDTIITSINNLPYWINVNGVVKCQSKKTVA